MKKNYIKIKIKNYSFSNYFKIIGEILDLQSSPLKIYNHLKIKLKIYLDDNTSYLI
jgi:hypothetical protein